MKSNTEYKKHFMSKDNLAEIRKVLIITLLLNLFVISLKASVGVVTGSLSLLADALHQKFEAVGA